MDNDFYTPPKSSLTPPPSQHRGSAWKVIPLCALLDIVITMVLSTLVLVLYASYLHSHGLNNVEVQAVFEQLEHTHGLGLGLLVMGLLVSVYAGYLCAKKMNYNEYAFALILGGVLVSYAGVNRIFAPDEPSEWLMFFVLSALNVLVVIIGAHLYVRSNKVTESLSD